MLKDDLEALASPFVDAAEPETELLSTLGVLAPEVLRLQEEVLADFDATVFGVGWWAPTLKTKRRILISDYLYQAVSSIHDNLVEAKLHILELRSATADETRRMENSVERDPDTGDPVVHCPPNTTPLDLIHLRRVAMHTVGATQALSSALDCLSAAIVGVGGLRLDIQQANHGAVRRHLGEHTQLCPEQVSLGQKVDALEHRAGPAGWRPWLSGFRNMALHRGRRLTYVHLVQRRPVVLGPDGSVVPRADSVPLLPAEPAWSDVQAWIGSSPRQLAEPSEETLRGLLASMTRFCDGVASELTSLWQHRRSNPGLIPQPAAQWKRIAPGPTGFPGYSPQQALQDPDRLTMGETDIKRMVSAAIDDRNRSRWDSEFE